MKSASEILDEVLDLPRPSPVVIMETALRNLIERAESTDITQEEIALYLCGAAGWNYYEK